MVFYDVFLREFRTFSYADGIMYEMTIHEAIEFHDEFYDIRHNFQQVLHSFCLVISIFFSSLRNNENFSPYSSPLFTYKIEKVLNDGTKILHFHYFQPLSADSPLHSITSCSYGSFMQFSQSLLHCFVESL